MNATNGFLLYVPPTSGPEGEEADRLIDAALASPDPDLEVLFLLAAGSAPIDAPGLAFVLAGRTPTDAEIESAGSRLERWIALSLAWRVGAAFAWVPRGIAASLRARMGEAGWREHCRRLGAYRVWRLEHVSHGLRDAVEAVRRFLDAGDFRLAGERAVEALEFMEPHGRPGELASFAEEVLSRLPKEDPHFPALCRYAGDASLALGQEDAALEHFRRALKTVEEWLELEPDRLDLKRDMSVSLLKIGDTLQRLDQLEAARLQVLRALGIRERLLLLEPGGVQAQRDVYAASIKLGDVLMALGDEATARLHFLRALKIGEALRKGAEDEP